MRTGSSDYVQSLERGLNVIKAFDVDHPELTLSEVASITGLTRAAARRFLLTLEALGYVGSSHRRFFLRPRVLELGYSFLSGLTLPEIAMPHLDNLANQLRTASSISVLDGKDIVYVARAATRRIMSVNITVGTRFPAVHTSMGRAILAFYPEDELETFLKDVSFHAYTKFTITTVPELRAELKKVHDLGYCLLNQELELGLVALAVPIKNSLGEPIAAVNVSIPGALGDPRDIAKDLLAPLREHAQGIERDLQVVPVAPKTIFT